MAPARLGQSGRATTTRSLRSERVAVVATTVLRLCPA